MENKNDSQNTSGEKLSVEDKQWLESLELLVERRMKDHTFNVDVMSKEMHLSRAQFFRKLKKMTGSSPSGYLTEARLQKAKELLESKAYSSVKAVAIEVGIQRIYFSAIYKKRFGKLPSKQLQK